MEPTDPRAVLERLIRERGDDYRGLSRMLGRNPTYVQQFIKRGSPRKLSDEDRHLLARYFGIDEQLLAWGVAPTPEALNGKLVPIPRYDVGASAGYGAFEGLELPAAKIAFDSKWLRQLCSAGVEYLSIIRVEGDSMLPTLSDGDDIMVDRTDGSSRLRDGIYVLRREDTLLVKRLSVNPSNRMVTISSDNPAYPSWSDCRPRSIDIIGRVVWTGRRLS